MNRLTSALLATAGTAALLGAAAVPAHAAAGADLVVTRVSFSGSAVAGAPLTFKATIRNVGTAATRAGVVHGVRFQVDGVTTTWSDTSTASLAPGASRTVTANSGPAATAAWTAAAGSHVVTADVDDVRRLAEADESNNRLQRTVRIAAARTAVSSTARLGTDASGAPRVVVDSALTPSARATTVRSAVTGTASVACFRGGALVPGTERSIGSRTVGSTTDAGGSTLVAVAAEAPARSARVSAEVSHEAILRSDYGAPSELTCPAGAVGDFARWHVTRVESVRTDAATGAVTGTSARDVDVTLTF